MEKSTFQKIESYSDGYLSYIQDSGWEPKNRILCGTPTLGIIRVEWHWAKVAQIIPTNWAWVTYSQYLNGYIAMSYQVDDAQNMICRECVRGDYEWLLLYEHDVLPPPDALVRLNEYMKRGDVPVVSGLYYTRSIPSEPLVYRGRGTGAFEDFGLGDMVWCDGVPTGFLLINGKIIRAMWEESPEYNIRGEVTRRVFHTPNNEWFDPESEQFYTQTGTSDLAWCERVMKGGFFAKAGYPEYQEKKWPFLVDTNIFCRHIEINGQQYPPFQPRKAQDPKPETLGVVAGDGMKVSSHAG